MGMSPSPEWNFVAEMIDLSVNDSLIFTIYQDGLGQDDTVLGTLILAGEQFNTDGVDVDWPLATGDGSKACLKLKSILDQAVPKEVLVSQNKDMTLTAQEGFELLSESWQTTEVQALEFPTNACQSDQAQ